MWTDLALWSKAEAQSVPIARSADVSSRESATSKRFERERIVTWGRRFEGFTSGDVKGVAGRNRRREFDNSAVCARRQEVHVRPSTIALLRFADRAVKAASRAHARAKQRGAP